MPSSYDMFVPDLASQHASEDVTENVTASKAKAGNSKRKALASIDGIAQGSKSKPKRKQQKRAVESVDHLPEDDQMPEADLECDDALQNIALDSLQGADIGTVEPQSREELIEDLLARVMSFNDISKSRLKRLKQFCLGLRELRVDDSTVEATESFGDAAVDRDYKKFVRESVKAFDKHDISVNKAKFVKPSGNSQSALLLVSWNYPPLSDTDQEDYGSIDDPRNGCIGLMLSKLGLPRTSVALTSDMFMVERWYKREAVPSGKEFKNDLGQPYDVYPEEIVTAHADLRESLLGRAMGPLQIELGTRNVKLFARAARAASKSHQLGQDDTIERLVFFIQHPQAVFRGQTPARAKICDAQWNLVAALCHRSSQYPGLSQRVASKIVSSLNADREFWSNNKQGLWGVVEMRRWEKDNKRNIADHDLPDWLHSYASHLQVEVTLENYTLSLPERCYQVASAKDQEKQKAGGYTNLIKGQQWHKDDNFTKLKSVAGNGRASQKASDHTAKWHKAGTDKRAEDTEVKNDPSWPKIKAWAIEHDRKHKTIGKHDEEDSTYTHMEVGKMVRYAKYTLKQSWLALAAAFGWRIDQVKGRMKRRWGPENFEGDEFKSGPEIARSREITQGSESIA